MVVELVPLTDRAPELLDQTAGTDGFDAELDKIEPDWREHLNRTPDESY